MFARSLIGTLAVIASAGCDLPVDGLGKDHGDNRPMTGEDAYLRQLDLDVAAIIEDMARAHGAQVVASMPEH
jgi:hypothetical protein